ncbi:MAG TPA: helix-turn-helix transcriptional regulator [Bryobacteraceae bacterium]|nr:helix-turn-helix transcriptional regulator [Bryobacteraceae bacterium]
MPVIHLTDREQEVLKWAALGKTRIDIGEIMCLSEHTIDTHIRRAMRKLDANNITMAAFRALHMGLIQS